MTYICRGTMLQAKAKGEGLHLFFSLPVSLMFV